MKNIFIDAGAFHGLYIRRFKKSAFYSPDFKIYAFECNPHLDFVTYGEGVKIIRKALWVCDGKLPFYVSKENPERVQGSSVHPQKITGNLDRKNHVMVDCLDFSKFLLENTDEGDNVIVKMNIEGAEYQILQKCLNDGSLSRIKKLFIQWHHKKILLSDDIHNKLVQQVSEKTELIEGFKLLNG